MEKEEIATVSPLTTMSKTRDNRSLLFTARFNIFVLSLLTLSLSIYIYIKLVIHFRNKMNQCTFQGTNSPPFAFLLILQTMPFCSYSHGRLYTL